MATTELKTYRVWFPGEADSATQFQAVNMDAALREGAERLECARYGYTGPLNVCCVDTGERTP